MILKKIKPILISILFVFFSVQAMAAEFKAPDFSIKDLRGKDFSLYRELSSVEGKDTVLFFWTTWCPHCRKALKDLSAVKQEKRIVTVNIGEPKERVNNFVNKNNYSLTVLLDEDGEVSSSYAILGIPAYVIVGSDLNIKEKGYGLPQGVLK